MDEHHTIDRLLFVYNADGGKWNAFVDSTKKLFMVNGCALCSITHGLTGEKRDWKDCRDELGVPIDYVHRDEITPRLKEVVDDNVPAVVAEVRGRYILLMGPDVLERCRGSVADFRGRLHLHASMKGLLFPEWLITHPARNGARSAEPSYGSAA
jgi:hypothetical protein